jgi:hypothetical protein
MTVKAEEKLKKEELKDEYDDYSTAATSAAGKTVEELKTDYTQSTGAPRRGRFTPMNGLTPLQQKKELEEKTIQRDKSLGIRANDNRQRSTRSNSKITGGAHWKRETTNEETGVITTEFGHINSEINNSYNKKKCDEKAKEHQERERNKRNLSQEKNLQLANQLTNHQLTNQKIKKPLAFDGKENQLKKADTTQEIEDKKKNQQYPKTSNSIIILKKKKKK